MPVVASVNTVTGLGAEKDVSMPMTLEAEERWPTPDDLRAFFKVPLVIPLDDIDRLLLKLELNSGRFPSWPLAALLHECDSSLVSDEAACVSAQSPSAAGASDIGYCRDALVVRVWCGT